MDNKSIEEKSMYQYNKQLDEQLDYQNDITSYINRKHENSTKKEYNPKIVNLTKNGLLVIDNNEYELKDFFIVFDSNLNNFTIKCINSKFPSEDIEYNHAVRFIDTTAFIKLIKESNIIDNKIIIDSINTLNNIVKEWDGYLHSETVETDSILNKKIIK